MSDRIISSLFLQDYGEDIILSTRTKNETQNQLQTEIYRISNIERYVLIAKLPKYSNENFIQLVEEWLKQTKSRCVIDPTPIQMFDSNVSLLGNKWTYFKIKGSLRDLNYLAQAKETDLTEKTIEKRYPNRQWISFEYDNYLVPDFTPRTEKIVLVSVFYKNYYDTLMTLQKDETLQGLDKLILPYLRYPFRQVGQNYISIQYKYKINFFNPLRIKNIKHTVTNPTKYRADVVHYVDIDDIENVISDETHDIEQIVQDQMENYCSIMFDIENFVFIPSTPNDKVKKKETYNLITQNAPRFSELSNSYYQTFNKNSENKFKFSDQEQITSISFIEQNFKSQILKKFCVINVGDHFQCKNGNLYSSYGDLLYTNDQIKDKINNGYNEQEDTQNKISIYADQVFIYNNERELLLKTIEILTSPNYHIVQHFNGWKFDEPMLCIRLLLYNLLDNYIYQMCPIYQPLNDIKRTIPNDAVYKQSAQNIESYLTQIKSPLKFSLDVYQLNLHDDVGAQKHDGGNSLNSLLKYHNLGLKGDISYQQICDAFEHHDIETLIKAAWYCQRDSIQQARLQQKLRIILNHIQFARLCQISLKDSVQQAVGTKVISTAYNYYANNNVAFQDILMPYQKPQTITIVVSGQTREHKVTNIGGEVECFLPGFNKCISAVDAASMYPAQIEANNVSNNCMLYPYQMDDILQNLSSYNISDVKLTYLIDLYSPYKYEKFVRWTPITEQFVTNYVSQNGEVPIVNMLNYVVSQPKHKKQTRLRIEFTFKDSTTNTSTNNTSPNKTAIYEQFYFDKKDITNMTKYVWYLQGKNPENGNPWSPRSNLLTTFRFLRKGVKKQIKEATDPDLKAFYDGKQGAIKVCMNSLYGTTDTTNYSLFENIGAAIITRCSKCEIRNCRDNIQATGYEPINTFYIQPRHKFDELKPLIKQYNTLCRTFFKEPSQTLIYVDTVNMQYIKFPKLSMKYQDTDSNYFIMDVLDNLEMKSTQEIQQTLSTNNDQPTNVDIELLQEHYVKPHILGLFNLIFSSYINNSMNKFPLEFSFEGAFYRAWHIGKKQYLGQKVPQFTLDCKFNEDNTKLLNISALKGVHITNHIQLSDYDPDNDDIYVFIASRHLKVTGIKIVKRDATLLTKKYYMKFIEQVLNNEETHNQEFMLNTIASLIDEIKQDFLSGKIPLKQITLSKKISANDMAKSSALQQYNELHPSQKLGLGQMFYKYVHTIENQNPLIFQLSGFNVVSQTIAITEDQLNEPANEAYFGYYLLQVAKSLVSFEMLYEDEAEDTTAITKTAHSLLLNRQIIQDSIKNYRLKDIQEGLGILGKIANSVNPKCKYYFHTFDRQEGQKETQKIIVETLINGLIKKKNQMTSQQQNYFDAWIQMINSKK